MNSHLSSCMCAHDVHLSLLSFHVRIVYLNLYQYGCTRSIDVKS